MKNLSMVSWDGYEDLEKFTHLQKLEELLGGDHAIACSSKQAAVQMCLEVMGTRAHMIPVIMPATVSIEVFTGVLWSGAMPIILDVDISTQQVKLDDLKELLEGGHKGVVILDRAGGYPIAEHVIEACLDVPTIAVSRCAPHDCIDQLGLEATFNIFDLSEVVGSGAVIFHKFEVQQKELRQLRGGPLGHKCWLTEELCKKAHDRILLDLECRDEAYYYTHDKFEYELNEQQVPDIMIWSAADLSGPIYFHVPDAQEMVDHLTKHGIPCRRTFYPLHHVPEIGRRLPQKDEADYSGAELLHNTTVIMPSHYGMMDHVPFIVNKMKEVVTGGKNDSRSPRSGVDK